MRAVTRALRSVWSPGRSWAAARLLLVLVPAGLAVRLVTQGPHDHWGIPKLTTNEAGLVLGALAIVALAAVLTYDRVLKLPSMLSKVTVGPVAVEWVRDSARAAEPVTDEDRDDDERRGEGGGDSGDLLDTRFRLEDRLTWLARRLVGADGEVLGFLTIGSMHEDRMLTSDQARTATRVLTATEENLRAFTPEARELFLSDANELINRIRHHVFRGLVENVLSDSGQRGGAWEIEKVVRTTNPRPDLLVYRDGVRARIATVFTLRIEKQSVGVRNAHKRLARKAHKGERAFIVVPTWINRHGKRRSYGLTYDTGPRIVTLDELRASLAELSSSG